MALPVAQPDLYDNMGISYEENFAHDQGLISFIHSDILPLTSSAPSASVLDLGIGTGKPVAAALAAAGRRVTGVDYSSTMLSLAQKVVPSAVLENAQILDFDASGRTWDAAITSMSLFNFSHAEMKTVARRVAQWVEPAGYWFIVTIEQGKYGQNERVAETGSGEDEGARVVGCNFLGNWVDILLYTEDGWKKLLEDAGWELVTTKKHFFEMKGEGDDEPHVYMVAKKK